MDPRMKFLDHELSEQERELTRKHNAGTESTSNTMKFESHEVLALKVRELEAMVKGLTDEMLDLKSITRKLSMQFEEICDRQSRIFIESRANQKLSEENPVPKHLSSMPSPRSASMSDEQSKNAACAELSSLATSASDSDCCFDTPIEQLKSGEFEYLMQPDGTILKRKKTKEHDVIIAGTGYNPDHTSRSMAIRADSDAVIEASEIDAVEDDAKRRC